MGFLSLKYGVQGIIRNPRGKWLDYEIQKISPDTSFLEMLGSVERGPDHYEVKPPISFDYDCRGRNLRTVLPVYPMAGHMDHLTKAVPANCTCGLLRRGETIYVEPFPRWPFPHQKKT